MIEPVLTVNVGSSGVKLATVAATGRTSWAVTVPTPAEEGIRGITDRLPAALRDAGGFAAVGHRLVHGGPRFTGPVRVDEEVLLKLAELSDLAPLHQPRALAALQVVRGLRPDAEAVACFDTAFHHDLPAAAACYPVPATWRERFGLRRYGFHGLSHAHASRHAPTLLAGRPARRVVVCHLGSGASLAAVQTGRCVDTTMGFTPADGLVQSTRTGALDPGLLLWLLVPGRLTLPELREGILSRGGLTALAGTGDMAEVLAARGRGEADARLAVEVWRHRLVGEIGRMVAALRGLDLLVFTGGVGENAPELRALVVRELSWLGLKLDVARNEEVRGGGEGLISWGDGPACVVVTAREDLEIAAQVRAVLDSG
ncbi:acetate kinase [Crossiella equi]|uniref:Acetate kinase n=1 Tax=Crossiella equi TaxID=130796 RepID=A0ABS5AUU6_9PSEU|nr:hypothetical protein [Crossiella equi]MBP2479485.1 acetate kinase [Crossiella equi]